MSWAKVRLHVPPLEVQFNLLCFTRGHTHIFAPSETTTQETQSATLSSSVGAHATSRGYALNIGTRKPLSFIRASCGKVPAFCDDLERRHERKVK